MKGQNLVQDSHVRDAGDSERLLRENELLFERVPCYVSVLDRDLRVVRANRRMRETFGGRRGAYCYRVYKRRDAPCLECPALRVFRDGLEHTSRQSGVTATGEEAHYVVTAAPFSTTRGPGGTRVVDHVIEMSVDITTEVQLQREMLEAERLAAVGQTVAGLAHGIKNILMGMEGGVYVMRSGSRTGQPARVERGLEMLDRNLAKVSALVKNLLAFSKGTEPHVAVTDPNHVAQEVLDLYAQNALRAGVELRAVLQPDVAPAPLDAAGIHTCLANLVSNAIDACQACERPNGFVELRTSDHDGVLCFEVADSGCGMDQEIRRKIFTTFFTTKGAGGTGLGLLMTRKIVQEHGGRVDVESSLGEGTVFRIRLPRRRLPEPAPREPADTGTPDSAIAGTTAPGPEAASAPLGTSLGRTDHGQA